ncbi:hypothetical protein DITRI_Ditri11bG0102400 [Diplodiscus trichospermus]
MEREAIIQKKEQKEKTEAVKQARMEREAIIQKKEQKEKTEAVKLAQRKAGRKEMFKKTRHGQPVMKYRIHHLLQNCSPYRVHLVPQ